MNAASVELCLSDSSLLSKRGELLALARKKVNDQGYRFKKGTSRSKIYGSQTETPVAPKRPKYDKDMREERMKVSNDELGDIARMLTFKEKRLSQAEAAKNYKLCEQVTEELMALKSKKREIDAEKSPFEKKSKCAYRRERRSKSRSSETDGGLSNSSVLISSAGSSPSHSTVASSPPSSGSRINPIDCESPPSPSNSVTTPDVYTRVPIF